MLTDAFHENDGSAFRTRCLDGHARLLRRTRAHRILNYLSAAVAILPESISAICRSITDMTKRENGPRSRYMAANMPTHGSARDSCWRIRKRPW